jgi:hypothetical protein
MSVAPYSRAPPSELSRSNVGEYQRMPFQQRSVLDGLTGGKSYVVEVAAVNAAGTGPAVRATVIPSG